MQRYLDQLRGDLRAAARERKARPDPLAARFFLDEEEKAEAELTAHISEVERYLSGMGEGTFYEAIGLAPEAFPPVERLSVEQVTALTHQILTTLAACGILSDHPAGVPAVLLYPQLLRIMNETYVDSTVGGTIHQEYCHYEPSECPWPHQYCTCASALREEE